MSSAQRYHRDFETRSYIDLKKTGARAYMQHPTTDVWCCAYAIDDGPIEVWRPGMPVPVEAITASLDETCAAWAHNNVFETLVEKYIAAPRYGFPEYKIEQQRCTMAAAYAMSLPGSLDRASTAVGLDNRKDMAGQRMMMQMARPRKIEWAAGFSEIPFSALRVAEMDADGWETYEDRNGKLIAKVQWWSAAEKIERLCAYCRDDVAVERAMEARLRPLSDTEQYLWQLDQVVNARGVLVDQDLARAAMKVVKQAQAHLDASIRTKTSGAVSRCSNRNELVKWVRENGVECESINKAALEELLADDNPLPVHVREVLLIRQEAAKASVAKIETLLNGVSPDTGRICDLLQFHAASTGRWGGRRFQPQNLRRPEEEDVDTVIAVVGTGDHEFVSMFYDKPLSAVADTLRGMLTAAPGHSIMAADLSNIEGRVLAWLAGEEWKLDAFRAFDNGTGHDLYKITAGAILNKRPEDVSKSERQAYGKVPELALGYQGGVGAFSTMAANYGVDLEREEIEAIRDGWREKHPRIKQFWYDMEDAAVRAVQSRGSVTRVAGKIAFKVVGSFLLMRLPSGRYLSYPFPEVREFDTPWGEMKSGLTYFSTIDPSKKAKVVDDPANTSNWSRIKTYGGMLAENATQAVARDVIAYAMPALEAAGYPIILTVHDEIVCEVPDGHGSVDEMEQIMCTLPEWAAGLPVAAEGFCDRRYRK